MSSSPPCCSIIVWTFPVISIEAGFACISSSLSVLEKNLVKVGLKNQTLIQLPSLSTAYLELELEDQFFAYDLMLAPRTARGCTSVCRYRFDEATC